MPIPGARYRVKTTKTGKKIRLAFKGKRIVEAKNLRTGETSRMVRGKMTPMPSMPGMSDETHARYKKRMRQGGL